MESLSIFAGTLAETDEAAPASLEDRRRYNELFAEAQLQKKRAESLEVSVLRLQRELTAAKLAEAEAKEALAKVTVRPSPVLASQHLSMVDGLASKINTLVDAFRGLATLTFLHCPPDESSRQAACLQFVAATRDVDVRLRELHAAFYYHVLGVRQCDLPVPRPPVAGDWGSVQPARPLRPPRQDERSAFEYSVGVAEGYKAVLRRQARTLN